MAPEMTITGLAELLVRLRQLPEKMQTHVVRGAVASGAAIIKNEAMLRAPYYSGQVGKNHPAPGTLRNAIYQARLTTESSPTNETWLVSVRKGNKAAEKGMDAYYATWVEYGTVKMSARPYMRPAFESKKSAAVDAMRDFITAKLPQAVKG